MAGTQLLIGCFDVSKSKSGGSTQAGDNDRIILNFTKVAGYDDSHSGRIGTARLRRMWS